MAAHETSISFNPVYFHGLFQDVVHHASKEEFLEKTSRTLKCNPEEIWIITENGNHGYAENFNLVPRGVLLVFKASPDPLRNRTFNQYKARVLVAETLYDIFYDTLDDVIDLCVDKLHIERATLKINTPEGKPFKIWKSSKPVDPKEFTKHNFIIASKKC